MRRTAVDCFVIVFSFPDSRGLFLAWDQETDEPLIFTSADDAKEEASTYFWRNKFSITPASLDGDEITVDYAKLSWQTFHSKAKQHSAKR